MAEQVPHAWADPQEATGAALLRDIAALPTIAPPTIAKTPARIAERYGVVYCRDCGFTARYCGCDSEDHASAVALRLREWRVR